MMQIAACSVWCTMLLRKKLIKRMDSSVDYIWEKMPFNCKEGQF